MMSISWVDQSIDGARALLRCGPPPELVLGGLGARGGVRTRFKWIGRPVSLERRDEAELDDVDTLAP